MLLYTKGYHRSMNCVAHRAYFFPLQCLLKDPRRIASTWHKVEEVRGRGSLNQRGVVYGFNDLIPLALLPSPYSTAALIPLAGDVTSLFPVFLILGPGDRGAGAFAGW